MVFRCPFRLSVGPSVDWSNRNLVRTMVISPMIFRCPFRPLVSWALRQTIIRRKLYLLSKYAWSWSCLLEWSTVKCKYDDQTWTLNFQFDSNSRPNICHHLWYIFTNAVKCKKFVPWSCRSRWKKKNNKLEPFDCKWNHTDLHPRQRCKPMFCALGNTSTNFDLLLVRVS